MYLTIEQIPETLCCIPVKIMGRRNSRRDNNSIVLNCWGRRHAALAFKHFTRLALLVVYLFWSSSSPAASQRCDCIPAPCLVGKARQASHQLQRRTARKSDKGFARRRQSQRCEAGARQNYQQREITKLAKRIKRELNNYYYCYSKAKASCRRP